METVLVILSLPLNLPVLAIMEDGTAPQTAPHIVFTHKRAHLHNVAALLEHSSVIAVY
jgi:hypothetical protein